MLLSNRYLSGKTPGKSLQIVLYIFNEPSNEKRINSVIQPSLYV